MLRMSMKIYLNYQKRKEKNRADKEIAEMKYQFFTNVSHEFKTPLTLIITPLESLLQEIQIDAHKKTLKMIYRNAQGLLSLVNQLMSFRKIELKMETLSLSKNDLHTFLFTLCENFRYVAVKKGLLLNYTSTEAA